MGAPYYCEWCGDEIENTDGAKFVTEGVPNRDSRVVAAFHDDDLPCFGEAADYGWR